MISSDVNEKPVHLYLAGEAGTGKSYLLQLLIEAVKIIKIKAGDDLKKPPVLIMAPTANAAFLIGGKTIDSALGFFPMDTNCYRQAQPGKMSMMKFQYDQVKVIFCDEISMVGSKKLDKINFRLQDLAEGQNKHKYMDSISFIASGIKRLQLPFSYQNGIFQETFGNYCLFMTQWYLITTILMVGLHVLLAIGIKTSEFFTSLRREMLE